MTAAPGGREGSGGETRRQGGRRTGGRGKMVERGKKERVGERHRGTVGGERERDSDKELNNG